MLRAGSARLRFTRVPRVFFCAGSARVIAFKFLTTTTTATTTTTSTTTTITTSTKSIDTTREFRAFAFRAGSARVLLRGFRARRRIQISYYYYYFYYYYFYYYYY